MTVFLFIAMMLTTAVIVTVGLVSPKKAMVITSEIVIDKSKDVVFQYVKLLRNQEKYNKWLMEDPNTKMDYRGTDGCVGFIAAWQSKSKSGDGQQQIISINEGESYEAELRFKNHSNITRVKTAVEPISENKTQLTTTLSSTPIFPKSLMAPMMKKMIQKDLNENSANLKRVLESL